MSIEALWPVEFGNDEHRAGAGVVVFESGRIFGGDAGYYYLGEYKINNGVVTGQATATHYAGEISPLFAGAGKEYTVLLSGDLEDQQMVLAGHLEQDSSKTIVVVCTRRAELP